MTSPQPLSKHCLDFVHVFADCISSLLMVVGSPSTREVFLESLKKCSNVWLHAHAQTLLYKHTHTVFCDIFSHCTRLQVINMKCCTLLDNAAVICLTQSCLFLQSLCLSGCHMICDKSIVAISLKSSHLHALDLTKTKVYMTL